MNKKKDFFWLIFLAFVFIVFKNWFTLSEISAGDAAFYFKRSLENLSLIPYSWSNLGLGHFSSLLYSFLYFHLPLRLLSLFNLSWVLIEKLVWYWPFIAISIFSSWYFLKTLLPEIGLKFLGPFVYLFNTYILMIAGGGQISIMLAYAICPLAIALLQLHQAESPQLCCGVRRSSAEGGVEMRRTKPTPAKRKRWSYQRKPPASMLGEASFIKNITQNKINLAIISGLVLAIQISFEIRVAALCLAITIFYFFWIYRFSHLKWIIKVFLLPLAICFGVHFYWLLPAILLRKASYFPGLSSPGWVEFLSFADFSNSLSLLHPNWPENIFGKTYFMRPEFLLLPILAFSSLLFLSKNGQKNHPTIQPSNHLTILFFAFLALIGAFLAKGSKPPFGGIYLWLFKYFPGMNLFRDPTKFYLLVALSYSILIPFSLEQIGKQTVILNLIQNPEFNSGFRIKSGMTRGIKLINGFKYLVFGIFLVYWLFLTRPAWLGQLGGTFKAKQVPQEYFTLKDFIHTQEEFFRTLWIPKKQRFGFYSNNHPAVNADELPSQENLAVMGIKYIIIPYDSEEEIFLKDRKYDHEQRLALEKELNKVSWLKKIDVADKIAVYEMPNYKDHFFIDDLGINQITSWKMINPTRYLVSVKINQPPATLVFSETYDELWQAKIGNEVIPSEKGYNILNSFTIDKTGDFDIVVEFAAQKYVYWGGIISITTLLLVGGYLIYHLR